MKIFLLVGPLLLLTGWTYVSVKIGMYLQARKGPAGVNRRLESLRARAAAIFGDLVYLGNIENDDIITDPTRQRIDLWMEESRKVNT